MNQFDLRLPRNGFIGGKGGREKGKSLKRKPFLTLIWRNTREKGEKREGMRGPRRTFSLQSGRKKKKKREGRGKKGRKKKNRPWIRRGFKCPSMGRRKKLGG